MLLALLCFSMAGRVHTVNVYTDNYTNAVQRGYGWLALLKEKNIYKGRQPGNAINLILIAMSYLMFEQEEHKLVETQDSEKGSIKKTNKANHEH